jgi:hypothetical protein
LSFFEGGQRCKKNKEQKIIFRFEFMLLSLSLESIVEDT